MRWVIIVSVLGTVTLLLMSGITISQNPVGKIIEESNNMSSVLRGYTSHDVIRINNDTDFANQASQEGWQGDGTQSNPYVISGYDIDAHGAGDAIYIGNTSVYFVVENCYLHDATWLSWPYFYGDGIMLYKVSNGTIRNNNCSNNEQDGIFLESSSTNVIENNIFTNNRDGISLRDSSNNNIIENNTCVNNMMYDGIGLFYSCSNNLIINNTILNNGGWCGGSGIYMYSSSNNNVIKYNNISSNNIGIFLDSSGNSVIKNNTVSNNYYEGIYLSSSSNNIIEENNFLSNGRAGIYLLDSSSDTIINNTMIRDGILIDGDSLIYYMNNRIDTSNTVNGKPVYFWKNRTNNQIPEGAGEVILVNCSNILITNYNLSNSAVGIEIAHSFNITIKNNTFSLNNEYGIYVSYSYNSLIENNTCSSNNIGIYTYSAINNIIRNNIVLYNGIGIWLSSSSDNTIYNNLISNNAYYGIYIDSGSHNLIYNNSFYYNHGSGDVYNSSHVQGYDKGSNNHWNTTTGIGNYWHDWANNNETNDINPHDGIVDWPYKIDGSAGAKDYYPLKCPPFGNFPPSAPYNLTAATGVGYVNLTWSKPECNGNSAVIGYKIYRNGTYLTSVPADHLWYNDTNVYGGITYTYYVTAINSIGESGKSGKIQAVPLGLPSAPQNLKATTGNGFVNLSWKAPANTGGCSITEYRIYRDNSYLASVQGDHVWYNDTTVKNGINYTYYVTAVNSVGESGKSNKVEVTPLGVPSIPKNLKAVAGNGFVNLSWSAPENNGGSAVIGYNIYRNKSIIATVPANQLWYNDTNVTNGQTYMYYVTAANSVGESDKSNEISVTPMGIPSAPENLQATVEYGYVNLTWQPPTDDGGSKIIVYKIYRGTSSGNETYIGQVNGSTFNYTDKNISDGTTYYYYVTAVNSVGEGNKSNEVSISIPAKKSEIPWFGIILGVVLAGIIIGILLIINWKRKNKKISTKGSADQKDKPSKEFKNKQKYPKT